MLVAYADIKDGTLTVYKECDNYDQYCVVKNEITIARDMTYEAAARLYNSFVQESEIIPLF